ncbi:MAG TPA: D-alanyl-D-alanine carboxypeptidase, partial [Haliangium sp.]|nr:D-alanyl-D-alanine carboxypeptidase [Haliangium sp.]
MVCAALTVGVTTVHADREHGPAGSSRDTTRHAHSITAPSLRSRSAIPGLEREQPSVESELIEELRRLESQRPLRRGTTAIYVVDATTGRTIYAVHEDEPLNPASNVKLISTATALDVLGPDWRYTTRVLGPAPGPDGVVAGDLYLMGSYDPTLQAAHLGELAAALASSGIKGVHGDIVVGSEDLRDSLGLARIDVHVQAGEVGAAPAVRIDAGAGLLSEAARDAFLAQSFELVVQAQTARRGRGRIEVQVSLAETTPPRYRIEITGAIGKERRIRVERRLPEPQIYTAQLLRAALAQANIEVQGAVRTA